MPKVTLNDPEGELDNVDNHGLVFGAIVVSVLEQLGYDPASESAVRMVSGVLAACLTLAKTDHVNWKIDGIGKTLFVMLCDEEQSMRAAQLAHALSQQADSGSVN